jgi:hypothetical protein
MIFCCNALFGASSADPGSVRAETAHCLVIGQGFRLLSNLPTKRKVYFAFRFKDIMRVNNVRQSGKIGTDETKNARDFYDRSIWEQRSITDPESLKRMMREGVEHSSAVCVLVGTDTWNSRWVKYEIARAVG